MVQQVNLDGFNYRETDVAEILRIIDARTSDAQALVSGDGNFLLLPSVPTVGDLVADDTAEFQAMLNGAQNGVLTLKPGKDYRITDTLVLPTGRLQIDMNGAAIYPQFGVNYSKALFKTAGTANSGEIAISNGRVIGNCVVLDARFTDNNPNAGQRVFLDRITHSTNDGNRRAGTMLLLADQLDFCELTNLQSLNSDMAFKLGSAPPRRNCTQIVMRLLTILQVNTAGYLRGIDKGLIEQIDVSSCNSGFVLDGNNQRLRITNLHAEGIGKAGYAVSPNVPAGAAGYGLYFTPSEQNSNIEIDKYSTIDIAGVGGSANGSVYIGRCDTAQVQTIRFRDCVLAKTMEGSAAYKPIVNRGRLSWEGRFNFDTDVSLAANGFSYIETLIKDGPNMNGGGQNLLPSTTVLGLYDGAGTAPTITEVTGNTVRQAGHTISFNAVFELHKAVNLPYGWNTLDITGYRISGNPVLFVQEAGGAFNDLLRIQFQSLNDTERRWRISFWNPTANQSCKVGITNQSATPGTDQLQVSSIAVYRGYSHDDPIRPGQFDVMAALPAASTYWLGRTAIVRAAGVADAVHDCLRNSAGSPVWVAR